MGMDKGQGKRDKKGQETREKKGALLLIPYPLSLIP